MARCLLKEQKATHATKDNTIYMSRMLLVKRATKKKWSHLYMDVTVVNYDLSYREDIFNLPHTQKILLSDLEVFEVRDAGKSGLVIGIVDVGREMMMAYVVSERQCEEIGHRRWKTHLETLKKAENSKPTGMRLPFK
jgi:hypothetical protein